MIKKINDLSDGDIIKNLIASAGADQSDKENLNNFIKFILLQNKKLKNDLEFYKELDETNDLLCHYIFERSAWQSQQQQQTAQTLH